MSTAASILVSPTVRARVLKDCAFKLKVVYSLPCDLVLDEVAALAFGDIEVNEFSKMVEGAMDHFKFRVSEYSMATGIVGGSTLVVTYGKLGADADPKDRDWVERFVAERFGAIEFV